MSDILKISKDAPKPWWPGDSRVEPFMARVRQALERNGIEKPASTDIYNRAYEAVYEAIVKFDRDVLE